MTLKTFGLGLGLLFLSCSTQLPTAEAPVPVEAESAAQDADFTFGRTTVKNLSQSPEGSRFLLKIPSAFPRRLHRKSDVRLQVVRGEFQVEVGNRSARLSQGQYVSVAKGQEYEAENLADAPGLLLLDYEPALDPEDTVGVAEAAGSKGSWEWVVFSP
jgi:quercetin dioxygenase-like cupin family protein